MSSHDDPMRAVVSEYCPVLCQLLRGTDTTGALVWDGRAQVCLSRGREIRLPSGRADTLRIAKPVREVLGDSLPMAGMLSWPLLM